MNLLTESVELRPIGSCISYTINMNDEIWGEVLSYLDSCKLVKEMEVGMGKVIIYETDVVNEFLVRYEWDKGGKNFLFWRKESTNDFVMGQ